MKTYRMTVLFKSGSETAEEAVHDHIGAPIPLMVARVRTWLAKGKQVRIFTARVYPRPDGSHAIARNAIKQWSISTFGVPLPITYEKDFLMIELWDDRVVPVELNTGRRLDEPDEFDLGGEIIKIADKDVLRAWSGSLYKEPKK